MTIIKKIYCVTTRRKSSPAFWVNDDEKTIDLTYVQTLQFMQVMPWNKYTHSHFSNKYCIHEKDNYDNDCKFDVHFCCN